MYILSVVRNTLEILRLMQGSLRPYLLLQLVCVVSAAVQVVGVASVAPLIGILSSPQIIQDNSVLRYFYELSGFARPVDFIIAFALLSALMILLSNFFSGLTLWLMMSFSVSIGSKLQSDLFSKLLSRDYLFHKMGRYTDSISLVSQEAPRFVYMILQQFLLMTSNLFMGAIIIAGLLIVDYKMAMFGGGFIVATYLLTYIVLRNQVNSRGKAVTDRNTLGQMIMTEAFKGVKDIKLRGVEPVFVGRFSDVNHRGLGAQAYISLAGDLPKLVIEAACFCLLLIFSAYLLYSGYPAERIITILSLYAVAGYKLLPTGQQIFKAISTMSGHGSAAHAISSELRAYSEPASAGTIPFSGPIELFELKNIRFRYPGSPAMALDDLTVTFKSGAINTIVGPSGSGKSTLVDVLLGLIPPDCGEFFVNNSLLQRWQVANFRVSASYVPQTIFLMDDTVVANVALGVPRDEIDIQRVDAALRMANATSFVQSLVHGVNTVLGQDGQLLSGGQRQRIGIARALYNQSKLLVLDEPTSALDIESEYELMRTLHEIKDKVLVIIISHRPMAIKMSDNISVVKAGRLEVAGSYDWLMAENEEFRRLMQKSEAISG